MIADGVGTTVVFRHNKFLEGYKSAKVSVNKTGKPKTSADETLYHRDIDSNV